jgi:hypothetical protein
MLALTLSGGHLLLLFPAVGTLHLNQNLVRKTCYLKLQESVSQSGGADSVIFGCKICKLVDLSFIPRYISYVVIEQLSMPVICDYCICTSDALQFPPQMWQWPPITYLTSCLAHIHIHFYLLHFHTTATCLAMSCISCISFGVHPRDVRHCCVRFFLAFIRQS